MSDSGEPGPKSILTDQQQSEALALYRHLLKLRESGVRQALVTLSATIGVGQVGKRIEILAGGAIIVAN